MDGDVRPLFPQRVDHAHQVVVGAQRRVHRARPQPGDEDVLRRRLADDQRKVLILSVVAVKQSQLLLAVGRIVGGVQVERDRGGEPAAVALLEPLNAGGDVEVDELLEHRRRGQVLEPRQRRLRRQRLVLRQPVGDELEGRIVAQRVVIVAVLVAGEDAEHALAEHRRQRLPAIRLGIDQARRHALRELPTLIELPQRQQPRVAGHLTLRTLDNDRTILEKVELKLLDGRDGRFSSLRIHRRPPCQAVTRCGNHS